MNLLLLAGLSALSLGVAAVVLGLLWWRERGERRRLQAALDSLQAEAARSGGARRPAPPAAVQPADPDRTVVAFDQAAAFGGGDEDYADATVIVQAPRAQPADPNEGLPFLRVEQGAATGTVHHLPYGLVTLGRDQANAIPLEANGASRRHCEVLFQGHGFRLRDLNSTNGTFHNGVRVEEATLSFGDRIKLGDHELLFTCEGYEIKDSDPEAAIAAFERCLRRQPDFADAIRNLAFLLERNLARRKEAQPLWDRLAELERSGAS